MRHEAPRSGYKACTELAEEGGREGGAVVGLDGAGRFLSFFHRRMLWWPSTGTVVTGYACDDELWWRDDWSEGCLSPIVPIVPTASRLADALW